METSDYEPNLDVLSSPIDKLIQEYPKEFDKYRLDEIVVGAISSPVSVRTYSQRIAA